MAVNLMTAYVEVVPSMKGFHKPIKSALGDVESEAGRSGERAGGLFGGRFGKVTSGIGKVIGFAGIAGIAGSAGLSAGAAFTKGFGRLQAIDQAKAKLRGLGRDAGEITSIMDSVTKSVTGTAFGLDAAANSAAVFSTIGVKSGKDMDRVMTLLADTTAQAGSSFDEMTPIFAKIRAQGGLTTDTFDQLNERATGVGEALSKHLGIPMEEVRDKAKEIDFETFATAMEKNIGGAAQETGKTFQGAWDNMNAALGRVGAKLLEPLFNAAPPIFDKIGKGIDVIGKQIQPAAAVVKDFLGTLFGGGAITPGWMVPIKESFAAIARAVKGINLSSITGQIVDMWARVQGPLTSVRDTLVEDVLPTLFRVGSIAVTVGGWLKDAFMAAWPTIKAVAGIVAGALATGFNILYGIYGGLSIALKGVVDWMDRNREIMAGVALVLTAVLGPALATALGSFLLTKAAVLTVGAGMRVYAMWTKIVAVATKGWAIAQGIFNAVMAANPIAIVVIALVALVAGIVLAWKRFEGFRNIVTAVWEGIKTAVGAVWEWISGTLWPGIKGVFDGIGAAAMWLWNNAIMPAWNGIKAAISIVWTVVSTIFQGWMNIFRMIGAVATWLWQTVMMPVWNGIKAAISVAGTIIGAVITAVTAGFKIVASVAMWLWTNAIVPAWDGIQRAIQIAHDIIWAVIDGIKSFFQSVADKAGEVKDWIVDKWNAVVDFFKKMPGVFKDLAGRIFNPLLDAAKSVFNAVARFWNNTVGRLSFKAPSWIPGIGGKGFEVPKIPLLASGGKVRGPGTGTSDSILAALSNGEFVVNARATARWLPFLTAINGGNGNGKTGPIPAFATGGLVAGSPLPATGGEGGLKPISVMVRRIIQKLWPQITDIGGYRASDPFPDHPSGQALDIMIDDVGLGDAVKAWLMDNKQAFDLNYTIWQQKYEPASGGGNVMEDRGSPTQNHMDHIHALFGQIGSPPVVNPDVVPDGIRWPAGMEPAEPEAASAYGDAVGEQVLGVPVHDDPESSSTSGESKQTRTSWSAIVGDAASEQFKDLLDVLGLKDDPSWLTAYGELKDHNEKDETSGDGKGTGKVDPEDEARYKAEFEDAQLAAKRKHEDELAKLDSDYQGRIAATKDAAAKRKLREELAAEKRRLKREFEDRQRASKREFEAQKRQRAADAKNGPSVPPADPAVPAGEAPPSVDPNAPPVVDWKQGMGAEPWRPVMEWGIKRVGQGLTTAPAQVDAGVAQIQSESGGDPSIAQQIVDVNGTGDAAGVGLLQIIPGTWAANRDPSLSDDRRNGPANIVGALRYYVGRYGADLTKMWGKGHGYKTGGYTGNFGVNDVAGVVHGREFVINAEATERWRPALEAINAGRTPELAVADTGGSGRAAYAPVTNATFRDEDAYYQRQRRENQLVAARIKH